MTTERKVIPVERSYNKKVSQPHPATLTLHPFAELCPTMTAGEYADLLASVREHGVMTPLVVLFDDPTVVLDGRHRLRAALEIGLEFVPTVTYARVDPLGFVVAANIARRHLTTSQRAAVAADLANMRQGERTDRVDQPSVQVRKVPQAEAAEALSQRVVMTQCGIKSADL